MKSMLTIREAAEFLSGIEHKQVTPDAVRKCIQRHGVPLDGVRRVSVVKLLEARRAGLSMDKVSGSGEVAAQRVRKLSLECERLQIEIDTLRGTVHAVDECDKEWVRAGAVLRACAESFRLHETAKHPEQRALVDGLCDAFLAKLEAVR